MLKFSLDTTAIHHLLEIASGLARDQHHAEVAGGHLMRAIFLNSPELEDQLTANNHDVAYCKEWAEMRMEGYPKMGVMMSEIPYSVQLYNTLEAAEIIAHQYGIETIDDRCLLKAVIRPGLSFSADELKSLLLSEKDLDFLFQFASGNSLENSTAKREGLPPAQIANELEAYCNNLTQRAHAGELDPIIGREEESRLLLEVMGRRSKPNVIVVGDPGVGKTALVEGLALDIASQRVPQFLMGAQLYELDLGALLAGASYKGETEDRLKKIIAALKEGPKAILFIDEVHQLLNDNSGLKGLANLLKPELARGEITMICATTQDEYQKYIQKDEAFNRRFDRLVVMEPSLELAVKMLAGLLSRYEEHHDIKVAPVATIDAVKLAKRYLADRRLPDSAIGLLDRAMAALTLANNSSKRILEAAGEELTVLGNQPTVEGLNWWYRRLVKQLSPVLLSRLPKEWRLPDGEFEVGEQVEKCIDVLGELNELAQMPRKQLESRDVSAIVAFHTGIPLGNIVQSEQDRLLNMESHLSNRVIGQPQAVAAVSAAVLENRAGLTPAGRPIGSFFLLGPTGTGKTELAKSLAKFLFDDEDCLLRFDMSEFKEAHSAALLYGAPPGYVGYEEGGVLVNKIRHRPYSVCLFDEIEKAHPSVFDIFLQILDEGKLHDRLGKVGDFSNAVILFTSNVGSELIVNSAELPTSAELLEIMKDRFRPEFLGRLTEVIPFAPLELEAIRNILRIQLKPLHGSLAEKGITLKIDEAVHAHLASLGFSPQHGVRPLRSVIRTQLRRPLSRLLVSGQLKTGQIITGNLNEKSIIHWVITPAK